MKKYFLLAVLALVLGTTATVAQDNALYQSREFIHRGDTLPYRILLPENYDPSIRYPLVLFLHGAGERGHDNAAQLKHGSWLFTDAANRREYPAIVLFPQCPSDGFWAPMQRNEGERIFPEHPQATASMKLVEQLVKYVMKTEAIDKSRFYVLGISMGGMGTFDYVCRHPRRVACAIPICGGVNLERLRRVRHLPIRIYHGGADPIVSVDFSRDAYVELKAAGSTKVEYIEYPGVEHESWNNAFAEPDFLEWMFRQKR